MKKKLLYAAAVLSAVFCMIAASGCTSTKAQQPSTTASCAASFNEETYVWQDFMFPTNRTSGRQ